MEFVMMTIDEAKKAAKKDAMVLVSVRDLEVEDVNEEFHVRKFVDCRNIIEGANTIAKVCDEFVNQLRLFTESQSDVINYEPRGRLNTILLGKSNICS